MIADIIVYIITLFLEVASSILPTWQVWPDSFLAGLQYLFISMAPLNSFLPVDTFFTILSFMISFEVAFFTARIIMKVFNYFRGTGTGLDI